MWGLTKRWDGAYALKAGLALAVIALADWLFFQREEFGGAFGLIGLAIAAALALARPAVRRDRRAALALALAVLAALGFAYKPGPLAFGLFWVTIGLATLLPGTARFDDGWRWFQRLFAHGFKSLVGPLIDFAIIARVHRRRPARPFGLRQGIRIMILPLAGSAVILALFAQANPLIEQFFAALHVPSLDARTFARIIVAGFIGLITWGVLRPRPPRRLLGTFDGRGDAVIPGVSLASVTISLVLFNALFLAQNLMDSAFLWGGVKLPGDMTLADYAHRGAYPLLVTALLAAGFVLIVLRPGSQTAKTPLVRRLVMVWIGQNLFLVGSAALRTWDYVESYDLTRLRIAALLWMALVAAGLVLVLVRMLRNRNAAWLINANLATSGALLFAMCFVDTGEIAARWNVHHAREIDGTGAGLDLCYLGELGASAYLPLIELEQQQGATPLGQEAAALRRYIQVEMESARTSEWSWLNGLRLARGRALLGPAVDLPLAEEAPCHVYRD